MSSRSQHLKDRSALGLNFNPAKGLETFTGDSFNGINLYAEGFEKTPNWFFDPGATTSLGRGTFRNPFTTKAQLERFCSAYSAQGLLAGKVLGFKRGSQLVNATNYLSVSVSGTSTNPFYIVPYGDSAALPVIDSSTRKTDWNQSGLDTGQIAANIWKRTQTGGAPIWRGSIYKSVRMELVAFDAPLANLIAKGPGWFAYSANVLYFIPLAGENPNTDAPYYTSDFDQSMGFTVADVASKGGVIVCGLHFARSRANNCVITDTGTTGSSNNAFIGCASTDCGAPSIVGTGNGFSALGISAAQRMQNLRYAACYTNQIKHNSFELTSHHTGSIIENCYGYNNGDYIVELWDNCSNVTVRYNRSDAPDAHIYYDDSSTQVRNNGIVIYGYLNGTGTEDGRNSIGNVAYGNMIVNTWQHGLFIHRGEMDFYNNTVVCRYNVGGSYALKCGEPSDTDPTAGADTVKAKGKFVNNLVVAHWETIGANGALMYVSDLGIAGYNTGVTAMKNVWAGRKTVAQFGYWNDASQGTLAAFNTASTNREVDSTEVVAAGYTAFAASLDSTYKPTSGNAAYQTGTLTGLPAAMTRDVYGANFPAATPNVGAVQNP